MRSFVCAVSLGLVVATVTWAEDETFSRTIPSGDFEAAGLSKLSPEELARLDALVNQFKREAESRAARAAAAEQQKAEASRMAKLKEKLSPRAAVEIEPIETRIKGKFTGWQGKTVFYLENGERWQIANTGESYYTPAIENPRVKIEPASLGGFWMTVIEVDRRVRVRPLK